MGRRMGAWSLGWMLLGCADPGRTAPPPRASSALPASEVFVSSTAILDEASRDIVFYDRATGRVQRVEGTETRTVQNRELTAGVEWVRVLEDETIVLGTTRAIHVYPVDGDEVVHDVDGMANGTGADDLWFLTRDAEGLTRCRHPVDGPCELLAGTATRMAACVGTDGTTYLADDRALFVHEGSPVELGTVPEEPTSLRCTDDGPLLVGEVSVAWLVGRELRVRTADEGRIDAADRRGDDVYFVRFDSDWNMPGDSAYVDCSVVVSMPCDELGRADGARRWTQHVLFRASEGPATELGHATCTPPDSCTDDIDGLAVGETGALLLGSPVLAWPLP